MCVSQQACRKGGVLCESASVPLSLFTHCQARARALLCPPPQRICPQQEASVTDTPLARLSEDIVPRLLSVSLPNCTDKPGSPEAPPGMGTRRGETRCNEGRDHCFAEAAGAGAFSGGRAACGFVGVQGWHLDCEA